MDSIVTWLASVARENCQRVLVEPIQRIDRELNITTVLYHVMKIVPEHNEKVVFLVLRIDKDMRMAIQRHRTPELMEAYAGREVSPQWVEKFIRFNKEAASNVLPPEKPRNVGTGIRNPEPSDYYARDWREQQ